MKVGVLVVSGLVAASIVTAALPRTWLVPLTVSADENTGEVGDAPPLTDEPAPAVSDEGADANDPNGPTVPPQDPEMGPGEDLAPPAEPTPIPATATATRTIPATATPRPTNTPLPPTRVVPSATPMPTFTPTQPPTPTRTASPTPTVPAFDCADVNRFYSLQPEFAFVKVLNEQGIVTGNGNPFTAMLASYKQEFSYTWVAETIVRQETGMAMEDPLVYMRRNVPEWLKRGETNPTRLLPLSTIHFLRGLSSESCGSRAVNTYQRPNRDLAWGITEVAQGSLCVRLPIVRGDASLCQKVHQSMEQDYYNQAVSSPNLTFFNYITSITLVK